MRRVPRVKSLAELRLLASENPTYMRLACVASSNLGGPGPQDCPTLETVMQWLNMNAAEITEEGVVAEVNFCRSEI